MNGTSIAAEWEEAGRRAVAARQAFDIERERCEVFEEKLVAVCNVIRTVERDLALTKDANVTDRIKRNVLTRLAIELRNAVGMPTPETGTDDR